MTDIKKTPAVSIVIADDNRSLTATFGNGDSFTLSASALSPEILAYAAMHGLKQKLVDAAAISRDPETGRSATVADKQAAVEEIHTRLLTGNWNKPAGAGGGAGSGSLLYRALVRLYGGKKTPAEILEFLDGKTLAEQAALRKNARVSAIIAEIQAERADVSSIDTDAMLDEALGE